MFITLEGIDGCGKSTQSGLLAAALAATGHDVLRLREPGGVRISEQIRAVLLDPDNAEMGDTCELLLYEAARAQLVHEVIAPALVAGRTVVCDRFYDSTTAYQSFAAGLDRQTVVRANDLAVDGVHPDLTLVFDIEPEVAAARRAVRDAEDRMEAKGLAFQRKVAEGFRAIAAEEPARVKLIDATRPVAEVFADVLAAVRACGAAIPEDAAACALAALEEAGAGDAEASRAESDTPAVSASAEGAPAAGSAPVTGTEPAACPTPAAGASASPSASAPSASPVAAGSASAASVPSALSPADSAPVA